MVLHDREVEGKHNGARAFKGRLAAVGSTVMNPHNLKPQPPEIQTTPIGRSQLPLTIKGKLTVLAPNREVNFRAKNRD